MVKESTYFGKEDSQYYKAQRTNNATLKYDGMLLKYACVTKLC